MLFALTVLGLGCSPISVQPPGNDGANNGGGGGGGGETNNSFHPVGFAAADVHGLEAKMQSQDCRACHGADLTGGTSNVSCDSCHTQGWRKDCLFCHGGTDNDTGAPPEELDGQTDPQLLRFRAHTAHVMAEWTSSLECTECHTMPTDVLSEGHMFDDTPGVAEVTFVDGLANAATYEGAGTCSTNYCHGNGQGDNGTVEHTETMTCESCHAGPDSGANAWASMSGDHRRHLRMNNVTCVNCHMDVVDANGDLIDPELHVDGARAVAFSEGTIAFNAGNGRCNGSCHGDNHNETW